jgi:hypothetical protein
MWRKLALFQADKDIEKGEDCRLQQAMKTTQAGFQYNLSTMFNKSGRGVPRPTKT